MGSRNRQRETDWIVGRNAKLRWSPPSYPNEMTYVTGYTGAIGHEMMADTTSPKPWPDHALSLIKRNTIPLKVTGEKYYSIWKEVWDQTNPPNRSAYSYCPLSTPVNWAYFETKALANANPNKPDVDLPVFLFELREFPGMLRQLGRVLSKKTRATDVAGGYLAYSFGWAPLISDLRKLLKLEQLISKRIDYLYRAADKGNRIRRSLGTHYPARINYSYTITGVGSPPSVTAQAIVKEIVRVWFTVRLTLKQELPRSSAELRAIARRAVLGLNVSAGTLWEAMPWSWLIDYFVNIGDILDANRGAIPFQMSNMNIMAHSIVTDQLTGFKNAGDITCTGGLLQTETKSRYVSPIPVPRVAYRPFFTTHMTAIVGSLATVKALRLIGKR